MTFEERKKIATDLVLEFMGGYSAPRGLDDTALKGHVDGIAIAFAAKLPISARAEFEEKIAETFQRVRDSHKTYAWPVQAEFVEALPASVSGGRSAPQPFSLGDERAKSIAKAMERGESVAEKVLWDGTAQRLVNGGEISAETLKRYQRGSVEHHRAAYRDEAFTVMQRQYGDAVGAFF